MHHFFVEPEKIQDGEINFPSDVAHQIVHVLRLGAGDQVIVLDNQGARHIVSLNQSSTDMLTGIIERTDRISIEEKIDVSLVFGMTNRDKVEWILQKGTEVGVSNFQPFTSSRTIVQTANLNEKKIQRWEKIICEAAEQSGGWFLPVLNPVLDFKSALARICMDHDLCLLAWEHSPNDSKSLTKALIGFTSGRIALFVGPEGGFSGDEICFAKQKGCRVVSLGDRILRMETAAIIFPALVYYEISTRTC